MTKLRNALPGVATGVLVVCTVTLTFVAVRREFRPRDVGGAWARPRAERLDASEWQLASGSGHRSGPAHAAVTIVEFGDFQCPACARFAETVAAMRRKYEADVAFLYRHFPLSQHKFAYLAAGAAECAAEQGRFAQFHDLLFGKRDSIGVKAFVDFAKESGVPDLGAFESCSSRHGTIEAVERDLAAARRLAARATPTVFANGWRLNSVPDSVQLDSLIAAELRAQTGSNK